MNNAEDIARDLKAFAAKDYGTPGDRVFDAATLLLEQAQAIEKVREIHSEVPIQYEEFSVCSECTTQAWPCQTALALGDPND